MMYIYALRLELRFQYLAQPEDASIAEKVKQTYETTTPQCNSRTAGEDGGDQSG